MPPPSTSTSTSRSPASSDTAEEDNHVLAYCGLRPNEAFALRRRHRDDFGQLVIEGGLVEVRGRIVATDGKTHTSPEQGVPVTTAAAALGHDPAMFLRVYSHLYPDDLRGAAAALDAARTTETGLSCGADVVQPLRSENRSRSATV